jgi:SNF2 family DNA or RNA helicase
MQNCVDEIYSQIAFLQIPPYCEWELFRKTFVLGFKQEDSRHEAMRKFQALLRAILLRRTKKSKIDGADIVQGLPDKTIQLVYAVFDERQLDVYRTLESGAVDQMNKYQMRGTLGRNYTNALTLLLRLRQACLHPNLVRSTGSVDEEQVRLAKGV